MSAQQHEETNDRMDELLRDALSARPQPVAHFDLAVQAMARVHAEQRLLACPSPRTRRLTRLFSYAAIILIGLVIACSVLKLGTAFTAFTADFSTSSGSTAATGNNPSAANNSYMLELISAALIILVIAGLSVDRLFTTDVRQSFRLA